MHAIITRLKLVVPIVVAYGLLIYALVWLPHFDGLPLIAGLILMPMAMGSLTAALYDPEAKQSFGKTFNAILVILLVFTLLTVVLFAEGIICIAMALPIFLPAAALGAYLTRIWVESRQRRNTTISLALLPLLVLPLDWAIAWPNHLGEVTSTIVIAAPADVVWDHTINIPDLDPSGLKWTVSHNILHLPQPLDARMKGEGVGAVRYLKWHQGIHFREIVTEWDQDRHLAWTFGFDPDSIPPTIDAHINVNGPNLSLVSGNYTLEPQPNGTTRLTLTTRYRVATPMNSYLNLWGYLLLNDFHTVVLDEIDRRATSATRS